MYSPSNCGLGLIGGGPCCAAGFGDSEDGNF